MLSNGRGPLTAPSHGYGALLRAARHAKIPSHTSLWGVAPGVQNTPVRGVGLRTPPLRLWSALNVAIPGRTITPGVRAVEGCLGDGLFPMYVAKSSNQKFPVQHVCRIPIPQNPHLVYNRDILNIHLTVLHRYDNPALIPGYILFSYFPKLPLHPDPVHFQLSLPVHEQASAWG